MTVEPCPSCQGPAEVIGSSVYLDCPDCGRFVFKWSVIKGKFVYLIDDEKVSTTGDS